MPTDLYDLLTRAASYIEAIEPSDITNPEGDIAADLRAAAEALRESRECKGHFNGMTTVPCGWSYIHDNWVEAFIHDTHAKAIGLTGGDGA